MDASVQSKEKALSLIKEYQDRIKALGVKRLGLFAPLPVESKMWKVT